MGWGLPVLMTTAWAVVTGINVDSDCWYGYNHTYYYYIVEGPRLAVIAANILFLLNILRVLLTKLRNVNSGETMKVRLVNMMNLHLYCTSRSDVTHPLKSL